MRIFHSSDLHLGLSLSQFEPEAASEIRNQIELAFKKLEDRIRKGYYDGIILSGDVFEDVKVIRYFIMQISRLFELVLERGGFACYLSGNHDYWVREEDFAALKKYEKFCLFIGSDFRRYSFNQDGVRVEICGIGYSEQQPSRDITSLYPAFNPSADAVYIGVFHGDTQKTSPQSPYYRVDLDEIALKNYNYFAMGHVHTADISYNIAAYPGTPFPKSYAETGIKSANEVSLSPLHLSIEPIALVNYRIYDIRAELEADTADEVVYKAQNIVRESIEDGDVKNIIRFKLRLKTGRKLYGQLGANLKQEIFGFVDTEYISLISELEETDAVYKSELDEKVAEALKLAIARVKSGKALTVLDEKLYCDLNVAELIEKYDIERSLIYEMEEGL